MTAHFPSAAPLILLAVILFLVVYPLAMLLLRSLRDDPLTGQLRLDAYVRVLSDPSVYETLLSTFLLAIPRVALAMALAIALAWLIARSDLPRKGLVEGLILLMLFLPGLPWVIAWTYLARPNTGFLNRFFFAHLPVQGLQVNVFSYGGIIVLGALQIVSLLYLFILPAMKAMDAALEESSRISGAGARTTFFRIHLPLLAPALLGAAIIGFLYTLGSFELEFILGNRAGIQVVTGRIYEYIQSQFPPRWEEATALSMAFLALALVLVVLQWRILGSKGYAVISGRGYQARLCSLGRWRYPLLALVLGFISFFVLLPFAILLLNSFTARAGLLGDAHLSVNNWRVALGSFPVPFVGVLWNTVIVGLGAATVGLVLAALVAYAISRTHWPGRRALDLLSWVPWTLPATIAGFAYLWAFIFLPRPFIIYGTVWVLVLASVARCLPLGTRVLSGTMVQVGAELEESSRVSGASWLQTFRHIWFPILRPAFFSAYLLLFVFAVRSVDTVQLIWGPHSRVLATEIMARGGSGPGQALSVVLTLLMFIAFLGAAFLTRRHKML